MNDGSALTPILWFSSFVVTVPLFNSIIKINGITKTIVVIVLVLSAMISIGQTNSHKNKLVQPTGTKEVQEMKTKTLRTTVFSSEYALKTVQNYHIQNDYPPVVKGTALAEMFEQMKERGDFENMEWGVEDLGQEEYMVRFSHNSSTGLNKSKWRVTKDRIEAVNGYALIYTPELVKPTPTLSGNDMDKEIYRYLKPLLEDNLKDIDPADTEAYDEAESLAVKNAAEHFGLSEKEIRVRYFNVREY